MRIGRIQQSTIPLPPAELVIALRNSVIGVLEMAADIYVGRVSRGWISCRVVVNDIRIDYLYMV
jgi:hypothetical protein